MVAVTVTGWKPSTTVISTGPGATRRVVRPSASVSAVLPLTMTCVRAIGPLSDRTTIWISALRGGVCDASALASELTARVRDEHREHGDEKRPTHPRQYIKQRSTCSSGLSGRSEYSLARSPDPNVDGPLPRLATCCQAEPRTFDGLCHSLNGMDERAESVPP